MKKTILSALATVCLLTNLPCAKGQESAKAIAINNLNTEITGENLTISFDLAAAGLEMNCNGQLKLEFAVENADRRLVLPEVIYAGTQRYRFERRREILSDAYHTEPYHVYKGVRKNRTYELAYTITIPYYSWMEHASLTFREYTHDCGGDRLSGNGLLMADLNPAPIYVEPEVWKPDPALFPNLVCFLMPEVEEVKERAAMLELNINFPVNVTDVRPGYMNNPAELGRADSLVRTLSQNTHIDIRGVGIHGYASPEGAYKVNERLAKGRSEGFKRYLGNQYPDNDYIRNAHTTWTPEDWQGLSRLVADSDMPDKQEILAVVLDGSMAPDTKDQVLQKIGRGSDAYRLMLHDMYPKLRRIELRVDYTVQHLTDAQARELLYSQPELLSLEEIYRVARYYEPDSRQYREVYEIAVRRYPHDVIANNNAAAALLREGDAEAALPYLKKTEGDPISYVNLGAYYYIIGDPEKALEYFGKAAENGVEQAERILKLVKSGQIQ